MTPVIRDLGGLEEEVKMRESVGAMLGTQGSMGFGKEPAPLLGLRASRALWVSDSVM